MSRAALSMKIFAFYVLAMGAILVAAPNLVLGIFGLETTEVWVRVVGVLAFNIGIYYWAAAVAEARPVFVASVVTRALVFASFAVFVMLGFAKPVLVLFGAVDLLGGIWTASVLRPQVEAVREG
jgi:hypothetical protein